MRRWEVFSDVDLLENVLGFGLNAVVELVILVLVVTTAPTVEMTVHTALDFNLDQHT